MTNFFKVKRGEVSADVFYGDKAKRVKFTSLSENWDLITPVFTDKEYLYYSFSPLLSYVIDMKKSYSFRPKSEMEVIAKARTILKTFNPLVSTA